MCLWAWEPSKIRNGKKKKNFSSKRQKAIISLRHSVHTFHISQFPCWRFVNSSITHLTSVNILDLIELCVANGL